MSTDISSDAIKGFQYDLEQSDAFWKAVMRGEFDAMRELARNPRVCFNIQQQFRDSYVQTALDWAIVQNNKLMVEWLCDPLTRSGHIYPSKEAADAVSAWSFRYTITDFQERFPDLKQVYNGRKTYHLWHAAEKNKLQDMIEMINTGGGVISVNLIRAGKTALDFAIQHKNEAMAKYLLHRGARLCTYAPEELKAKFPALWHLTPPGACEKMALERATQILTPSDGEAEFAKSYPEVYAPIAQLAAEVRAKLIPALRRAMQTQVAESARVLSQDTVTQRDMSMSALESRHSTYIKQLNDQFDADLAACRDRGDKLLASHLRLDELTYMQKNVEDWSISDVMQWVKVKCPSYEPLAFYENLITGRELVTLSGQCMESMGVPRGPRLVIVREIEKLRPIALSSTRFYATSNYRSMLGSSSAPTYQDEVFYHLRKLIEVWCSFKSIPPQDGLDFFVDIQKEALERHKQLEKADSICARLWTSAKVLHKTELCSMLCEILREDAPNILRFAMPIIRGISHLDIYSRELIEWPEDCLLYRGGGLPTHARVHFTEGKTYRCPTFLAASDKRKIGEMFCNRATQRKIDATLYIFHLSDRYGCKCTNVTYVGSGGKSNIDSESEFLFFPYSVFTVRSIIWRDGPTVGNPHIIHLDVAVNSEQESEFLPLMPWH